MNEKLQSVQKIIDEFNIEVSLKINHFKERLKELNPSKTDPSLISNISVEAYGKRTRIKEIATIVAREGRILEIKVFDKIIRNHIRDAISHHSSHFSNISIAGESLLLKLEPLTGEYLMEIFRIIKEEAERTKMIIREIRRKAHKKIESTLNENKENIRKYDKKLQDVFEKQNEDISEILLNFKKVHVPRELWDNL